MSRVQSIRPAAAVFLSVCQFIPDVASGRAIGLPPDDEIPPEVMHTPLYEFPAGMPLRIQAMVTDDAGVAEVVLIYRDSGAIEYQHVPMLEAPGSDIYSADLPDAAGPVIEYFIQATDGIGNTTPDQIHEPYVITVSEMPVDVAAAPSDLPALLPAEDRESLSKWLWIGVGVAAVAVLAGGGGSSGSGNTTSTGNSGNSDDGGNSGTGTVSITAPLPQR